VVVGVVTWGIFGKIDAAKVLIRKKIEVDKLEDLKGFISLEDRHDDAGKPEEQEDGNK